MGRPREFDVDEALERAMQVFWAKGYDGTSLPDLLEAMNIARGSLYKAFQDKRSVYLAALDRYDQREVQRAVDILSDRRSGDGSARIRLFLDASRAAVDRRNDRRGCFLCNAAVEQAPMDPDVRGKVSAMIKRMERAIVAALDDAKVASAWPERRRALTALMLINAYLGLRVLARSGGPPKEMSAIIQMTLQSAGLAPNDAA